MLRMVDGGCECEAVAANTVEPEKLKARHSLFTDGMQVLVLCLTREKPRVSQGISSTKEIPEFLRSAFLPMGAGER